MTDDVNVLTPQMLFQMAFNLSAEFGPDFVQANEAFAMAVIDEFIYASKNRQPESPNVEQEPVEIIERARAWLDKQGVQTLYDDHPSVLVNGLLRYINTHPAPASDARVISYEDAHTDAVELGYPSLTEALEDLERLQKDRAAFDGLGEDAPSSDELLEALETLRRALAAIDEPAPKPFPEQSSRAAEAMAGMADTEARRQWEKRVNAAKSDLVFKVRAILAKHKGPQS